MSESRISQYLDKVMADVKLVGHLKDVVARFADHYPQSYILWLQIQNSKKSRCTCPSQHRPAASSLQRQVERVALQRRVLDDVEVGQWRVRRGVVLGPRPERAVDAQHDGGEDVAAQQQPQEVVAHELQVGALCKGGEAPDWWGQESECS